MLNNLIVFFGFIVNLIGFILLGILFQQITKYKLSLKEWIFFLLEIEVLLPIVNGILLGALNINPYLVKESTIYLVALYFIVISYKRDSKIGFRYHFFYGLYPIAFYIILHNSFFIICQSIFSIKIDLTNPSLIVVLSGIEPFVVYYLVSQWLNIDISNVSQSLKKYIKPKIFKIINTLMVFYFLLVDALGVLKPFHNADNNTIKAIIAFVYFVLLFAFLFYLNFRHGQEQKNELLRNQEMELKALENYSKHVESLYQEVRSFRHDYANVLMSLKVGIDQGDLDNIKKIYEEITADSAKLVKNNKFDLTRLANISDSAVKSLMSAKFLEAENRGIEISLEVSEPMKNPKIPLISYIRILSILFDNAVEGALESENPKIAVANFYQDGDFVFIIENSTKEKSVDLSKIFQRGYSTKGENRGLGLATLVDFQDDYENLSVETSSLDYKFTQIVRVYEGRRVDD